MIACIAIELPL